MRTATGAIRAFGVATLAALFSIVVSACGTTTVIYQTVSATPQPTAAAAVTATPPPTSQPAGIWCPVQEGQTPFVASCEIYPSNPKLTTPPQSETILAGTWVGPQIGSSGSSAVAEYMSAPWAADVDCATSDNSNTGQVRILMIAHTGGGDYYSWGDDPCGPPMGPSYGHEFFRKASVSITLSIQPLTNNLASWQAQLIQL